MLQGDESASCNMHAMRDGHNPVLSNDVQLIYSETHHDVLASDPLLIDEGYNTANHSNVLDSYDARSDEDDDAELADNPLVIDEDYETESDTALTAAHLPALINGDNDALHAIEKDENANSNYCLIDHDYLPSSVKNAFEANYVNSFTSIYQNENIVVMQDLFNEKLDWQESVQEKFFEEGNQGLELAECDQNNAKFVVVNTLRKDEFDTSSKQSFKKKENQKEICRNPKLDKINDSSVEKSVQEKRLHSKNRRKDASVLFVKNKLIEKLDHNDASFSNSYTKKESFSLEQYLNKTSSSPCQDRVVSEKKLVIPNLDSNKTVLNKEHTPSGYLQRKVLKPLKPKTGEQCLLLVPLIIPLKPEQALYKIAKTEQSLKKCIQVEGLNNKIQVKRSLLGRHKLTVTKRKRSETSSHELKNGKIPAVADPDVGNNFTETNSCSTSTARNSDKILYHDKTEDGLLKNQVTDSTEQVEGVTSDADFENPFDTFITGLNGTPDVTPDIDKFKSSHAGDDEISDIINDDTQDIKPDLDQVTSDTGPVKSTEVNSCEAGSVELKVLKCKECCSVFNDTTSFDLHLIWCDVEAKKSKICGVCRVAFPDLKSMNSHDCSRVLDSVDYTCGVCKKAFKKRDVVFAHMKIHTTKKDFVCEVCQKSFLHKHHLVTHMKTHQSDRPYKCQVCTAAFKRVSHLQKHQSSHKPDGERKYECKHCDWSFHDKYKLARHEKTHSSSIKKFVCSICQGAFREKYILTKHIKNVHSDGTYKNTSCNKPKQPLECEICSEIFFWKKHLQIHMASHSEVLCDSDEDADDDFKDELEMSDIPKSSDIVEKGEQKAYHTRNSLKGFGKVKCQHCTQTFISAKLMEIHTQTEHKSELMEGSDVDCDS
ncbi:zinc finger protein 37-like [Mercenaria mercenaria]|uniref:zinc finger protein 37-like n=1 Tax=Mercenaria mercenaria TaxID=6596 RepID=UPI00234EDCB8|nr:zinc finger protein 37-like [Mercenaria mercenaria]XP_045181534.2 zinc finger protein 37-like [Mercenaria mercenaria]